MPKSRILGNDIHLKVYRSPTRSLHTGTDSSFAHWPLEASLGLVRSQQGRRKQTHEEPCNIMCSLTLIWI